MSNYKALGIEKEMISEFENHNKSELQLLIESSYFQHPNIEKRKQGEEYCIIEVIGCSGNGWWYEKLFGMQFFCRIRFRNYRGIKEISEYLGVKLTNTKEIQFRTFDPRDVIII